MIEVSGAGQIPQDLASPPMTAQYSRANGKTRYNPRGLLVESGREEPARIPSLHEKLGFKQLMGDATQNWLILRNGTITIGLFQGMFDRNTFTFNPGWTAECAPLPEFTDVREIQKDLKAQGRRMGSR